MKVLAALTNSGELAFAPQARGHLTGRIVGLRKDNVTSLGHHQHPLASISVDTVDIQPEEYQSMLYRTEKSSYSAKDQARLR